MNLIVICFTYSQFAAMNPGMESGSAVTNPLASRSSANTMARGMPMQTRNMPAMQQQAAPQSPMQFSQQQTPQLSSMSQSSGTSGAKDCSYCDAQGNQYVCAQLGATLASLKNSCYAQCQQMTIKFNRKCTQVEVEQASSNGSSSSSSDSSCKSQCSSEYKPVCGSDNKTYENKCQAKCEDITSSTPGECSDDSGSDSADGSADSESTELPILNNNINQSSAGVLQTFLSFFLVISHIIINP